MLAVCWLLAYCLAVAVFESAGCVVPRFRGWWWGLSPTGLPGLVGHTFTCRLTSSKKRVLGSETNLRPPGANVGCNSLF